MDILLIYELKRDLSILRENAQKKDQQKERSEHLYQKIDSMQNQLNLLEKEFSYYGKPLN